MTVPRNAQKPGWSCVGDSVQLVLALDVWPPVFAARGAAGEEGQFRAVEGGGAGEGGFPGGEGVVLFFADDGAGLKIAEDFFEEAVMPM